MTASRVKKPLRLIAPLLACAILAPGLLSAQTPNRDASFVPVPDPATAEDIKGDVITPASSAPPTTLAPVTVATTAPEPSITRAPPPRLAIEPPAVTPPAASTISAAVPTAVSPSAPAPVPAPVPTAPTPAAVPTVAAPIASAAPVAITISTPTPVIIGSSAPSATPAATMTPAPAPSAIPEGTPVDLGQPVQSTPLSDINPESIGLLSPAEGGLSASMWKGTPYALVERLLPALKLPTPSMALNTLAGRFLLTTAAAPEGTASSGEPSLIALRVSKLVALGHPVEAWKLVKMAKPDQIDDATLRLVAETGLVNDNRDEICAQLPEIIKTHTDNEWQKLLLVCQLRAKDTKAAQLNIDLLRTQKVNDETLFALAEKNIIAGKKQLPRQLTPLKPLVLALLRLSDLPVRAEVYAHPDASLIAELLKSKADDEKARLALAERAAARGLLDLATLEDVYRGQNFTLIKPSSTPETGARLRAMLYQDALQQKAPQDRAADAIRFMQTLDIAGLNGIAPQVAVAMLGDIQPSADFNTSSDQMVLMHILAGKPEIALLWLKIARTAAIGIPSVANGLQSFWPLLPFAGLESDHDYARELGLWLDGLLKVTDNKADNHAEKKTAATILLLLEADGFAVPTEDWAKVADVTDFEKHPTPSAFLLEQLRTAGTLNHRGEAVLGGLLVAGNSGDDTPLWSMLETIRALRLAGLVAEASSLAREVAVNALIVPPKQ